jgi:hypothetical protein
MDATAVGSRSGAAPMLLAGRSESGVKMGSFHGVKPEDGNDARWVIINEA